MVVMNELHAKTLIVKNIHPFTTNSDLKKLFSKLGIVECIKRKLLESNTAFIEMSTDGQALNAENTLNGYELHGCKLKVQACPVPELIRNRLLFRALNSMLIRSKKIWKFSSE